MNDEPCTPSAPPMFTDAIENAARLLPNAEREPDLARVERVEHLADSRPLLANLLAEKGGA